MFMDFEGERGPQGPQVGPADRTRFASGAPTSQASMTLLQGEGKLSDNQWGKAWAFPHFFMTGQSFGLLPSPTFSLQKGTEDPNEIQTRMLRSPSSQD